MATALRVVGSMGGGVLSPPGLGPMGKTYRKPLPAVSVGFLGVPVSRASGCHGAASSTNRSPPQRNVFRRVDPSIAAQWRAIALSRRR